MTMIKYSVAKAACQYNNSESKGKKTTKGLHDSVDIHKWEMCHTL